MNTRGTSLLAVPLLLACTVGYTSCSEQAAEPETEPQSQTAQAPVAEEPVGPVIPDPPAPDYTGPVRGIFLDGTLRSADFVPEKVLWDRARLDFDIGDDQWPEASIRLAWLNRDPYLVPFGLDYSVKVDAANPIPKHDKFEIWLRYKIADTRSPKQKQIENYTLTVRTDPDSGEGGMTGFVDLVSEDPLIHIRGTFEAEFKGERTPYGVANPMAASDATLMSLFEKQFKSQHPDLKLEVEAVPSPIRRHKTSNKLMRLGYAEIHVKIEEEETLRSGLYVLTPEGYECVEVLEPWQIPEAFPVLEPQAPPNGNVRSYLDYRVASFVQDTISPDENVFGWKNELVFGGQPIAWCTGNVTYRNVARSKASTSRTVICRKTDSGWIIEGEVLPGEKFNRATGQIEPMTEEELKKMTAGDRKQKQKAQKAGVKQGKKGAGQKGNK